MAADGREPAVRPTGATSIAAADEVDMKTATLCLVPYGDEWTKGAEQRSDRMGGSA